jgi:hypothetical protein
VAAAGAASAGRAGRVTTAVASARHLGPALPPLRRPARR